MAYTAKAVANYFLQRGLDENVPICPMKLQKLLYYAQGWHLAFTDQPIINEQIECWPYGPVINSVFQEFKEFGGNPIARKARKMVPDNSANGRFFKFVFPHLPDCMAEKSSEVLDTVWTSYKGFSAVKLSNMTHVPGGPWHQVYTQYGGDPPRGTDIPMDAIKSHFIDLLNAPEE